jgi:hypothetical protein
MVFGLGKHDTKEDLDSNYYKRRNAYLESREAQRMLNAKQQGIADANAIQNKKPFYKKVLNVGKAIGKDLTSGAAKTNTDVLFTWGTPQKQTRSHKTSKKRQRKKKNPFSLL